MIKTDGGSYHVNETINRRTGAINRIQNQSNKTNSNQTNQFRHQPNVAHEKLSTLLKLHFWAIKIKTQSRIGHK